MYIYPYFHDRFSNSCFLFLFNQGHCLVLTRRVVPRIQDMDAEEIADLWKTVHLIAPKLQLHFNAEALTIAVQDGPAAGQTVPHVHVHIVPRKSGDFPQNDQVYQAIDNPDDKRKPRTLKEMDEEAQLLRPIFEHSSLPIPEGKQPPEE